MREKPIDNKPAANDLEQAAEYLEALTTELESVRAGVSCAARSLSEMTDLNERNREIVNDMGGLLELLHGKIAELYSRYMVVVYALKNNLVN